MTAATVGALLAAGVAGDLVASVAQPAPSPSAPATFEPTEVSPGLLGFVPVFLIALASLVLFLSLTRHLRRVTVRQAAVDARDAEQARGAGPDARTSGPGASDAGAPGAVAADPGADGRPGTPGPGDDATGRP